MLDGNLIVLLTTILTICSANYLAQAKTLADSVREQHPEYKVVIGLVDRFPAALDPHYCQPHEVLPVEDLAIPEFPEMCARYTIIELNTAVKPFYMEYLYRRNPAVQVVIYFDPDILILGSLQPLVAKLQNYSMILTPHCCSYDEADPNIGHEFNMLRGGIYNLGFLATARHPDTMAFLSWWQKRLIKYCFWRPMDGLFFDQHWAGLAPLYFETVLVEKDPGYNMAHWNLCERSLSQDQGRYRVNGQHDLVFFHFSKYTPKQPAFLADRQPPVLLVDHPELASLVAVYHDQLVKNQHLTLSKLGCYFYPPPLPPPPPTGAAVWKKNVKRMVRAALHAAPVPVQRYGKRIGQFIADNTDPR